MFCRVNIIYNYGPSFKRKIDVKFVVFWFFFCQRQLLGSKDFFQLDSVQVEASAPNKF